MTTGIVMYDIGIEADDAAELERIRAEINTALKAIKGVTSYDEVDCDLNDSSDEVSDE